MKNDTSELFSDIFKETDKIKASVAELKALYEYRIEQLEAENEDLNREKNLHREALNIIRNEVEEHGFYADMDKIVYQCDQALGDYK